MTNVQGDYASGTADISAGIIAIDGDILEIPAYTGGYPIYAATLRAGTGYWTTAPADQSADILFIPHTSQRLKHTVKRATYEVGEIRQLTIQDAENFTANGLGRYAEAGFAIANGQNGTVDMRDRFLVGSGGEYLLGAVGGLKEVTLTLSQIPSHDHTLKNSSDAGSTANTLFYGEAGGINDQGVVKTTAVGGGQAHENRPPYRAVLYVMRIQ